MLSEELAQRIVEGCLLQPGESISKIRRLGNALIVESSEWWRVETIASWRNFRKSSFYELYETGLYIFADPPPPPGGVALLQTGEMFCLNHRDEFQTFFQRGANLLTPLEIAGLLARYQGDSALPGVRHTLLMDPKDLNNLLSDKQIEGLVDVLPFQATQDSQGGLVMDFCTFFLKPEPPNFVYRIGLDSWHLIANARGYVEWSVKPIARGLDSPRYPQG